MAIDKV